MSQVSTTILLPQTPFNRGPTVIGEPVVGPGYYQNLYNLQTYTWVLTNVTCSISIQGTISETPTNADWINIHTIGAYNKTENGYISIRGNFNWLRVVVNGLVNGTIQNIKVTY